MWTTPLHAVVRIRHGEFGPSCLHASALKVRGSVVPVTQQQIYTTMQRASSGATLPLLGALEIH